MESEARSPLTKDIEEMMYGFGDAWPPNEEAVRMVEVMVKDYIDDLAERALQIASIHGKLDKDCFIFLVRKDSKKFNRVQKLLETHEKIEEVRDIGFKEQDDVS
mmetsp:Transcript_35138/g.35777  ORF Transcript_35138/g.35777 Transcript_35138/m.35777 type:complete len:104 (+) Transcript_35138:154-465(+)|eukprot:CAMPEP_0182420636 /NCGR_PEP_ID=MMETSP1167-20130531/5580_1 /TAXON_ID=2988 /ORGANISM="Mallomonas Sp, Strain CCMP3275" /LENGTH=103 /DNA_ID=CAMNT_0024596851 /DNA_START=137 /DNA_END=451 /DNA_ORIENTATION=-